MRRSTLLPAALLLIAGCDAKPIAEPQQAPAPAYSSGGSVYTERAHEAAQDAGGAAKDRLQQINEITGDATPAESE